MVGGFSLKSFRSKLVEGGWTQGDDFKGESSLGGLSGSFLDWTNVSDSESLRSSDGVRDVDRPVTRPWSGRPRPPFSTGVGVTGPKKDGRSGYTSLFSDGDVQREGPLLP